MPQLPTKKTVLTARHEWVIGTEDHPTTAKDFEFGLTSAKQDMESLGLDLGYDDAYHVRAGDGSEVIVYVEIEDKDEPGTTKHREGWCRLGDKVSGPWVLAPGAVETQQCQTCGRTVGK